MEVYLWQNSIRRNWYQIIQIVHASVQSWIATNQFYAPNRECIQPKPVSGIMHLVKMEKGILSGKRHNTNRHNAKRHNANRHNAKRHNANTHRGITQRGITQRGITPRGITRTNQRPWQRPQERTEHARKSSTKSFRIFWSVLWEDGVRELPLRMSWLNIWVELLNTPGRKCFRKWLYFLSTSF